MSNNIVFKQLIAGLLASLAVAGLASPSAAQKTDAAGRGGAAADAKLEQQLAALAAAHHGHVAAYAKHLSTGRVVAIDADQPLQTASVIKLVILFEAMEQVRAGKADWDDKITLANGDAVSGSGVLTFFDAPLTLTLKDVLTLMIIMSDNTATNLAIDRLGLDAVNARITWMGLKDTYLYRKVMKPPSGPMPADQPKFGLGKTTAREMATVLERIGRCQLGPPNDGQQAADTAICQVALTMLRNQFYRNTIPRYLDTLDWGKTGPGIASKTGSLNAVRNDVAIVVGKNGPMVISIFTFENEDKRWTADNEAELVIAKMAKAIVDAWSPDGVNGKLLVPGLGLEGVVGAREAATSK
jgi:beta-lactamase class A